MSPIFQRLALLTNQQVLIIAIVFGVGYYFTLYNNGAAIDQNIQQLQDNIRKEEDSKKQTDENLKKEKNMKDIVGLLGKQFQEVSQRLPSDLTATDLKKQIDQFAKIAHVTVKNFTPGSERKIEIVKAVTASFEMQGTYTELAQLIELVSKNEKVMSVRNISFEYIAKGKLSMGTEVIGYQMMNEEKSASEEVKK